MNARPDTAAPATTTPEDGMAEAPPRRQLPASRSSPRADQPDRRLNILLAAERLFAKHGYHGVSIRDIANEAQVPLALVGYHYGAKHELYQAIFESWRPMIGSRLERLRAALESTPEAQRLDAIIDAFVTPVIALHQHEEGRHYAAMAARELSAPAPEADLAQREFFDPMAHAFIDALCTVAPKATRGQVAWCYQFMLGALLHHLTDQRVERLSRNENKPADPAARHELMRFLGGGFRAVLNLPAPPGG